jgi:hypothetical protein
MRHRKRKAFLCWLLEGVTAFCLFFSFAVQAQTYLPEIASSDLVAYLKANEKIVVLFTSPDRKCGFCIGADETFSQAVRGISSSSSSPPGWRYIVVQWQPWREIPPQDG